MEDLHGEHPVEFWRIAIIVMMGAAPFVITDAKISSMYFPIPVTVREVWNSMGFIAEDTRVIED